MIIIMIIIITIVIIIIMIMIMIIIIMIMIIYDSQHIYKIRTKNSATKICSKGWVAQKPLFYR